MVIVTAGPKVAGTVVDAVSDVLDVGATDRALPPDLGAGADTSLLTGMARAGDRLVILFDIDRLVGATPDRGPRPPTTERNTPAALRPFPYPRKD